MHEELKSSQGEDSKYVSLRNLNFNSLNMSYQVEPLKQENAKVVRENN